MQDLRVAQERRLAEQAAACGSHAGLMYFHLARGRRDLVRALQPTAGSDDQLMWRLIAEDETPEVLAVLARDAGGRGTHWFAYTLAKRLLAHGMLRETLTLAKERVLRDTYDVEVLNLAARWAMGHAEADLARGIIDRSLNRNPYQGDLVRWLGALDSGLVPVSEPYLELAPKPCSVAFYIPVYNVERHVRQVLDGILAQWHPLDEVIVVDDQSPDASAAIAREYPVRVLTHETNLGLAAARNTAFRNTTCDFVAAVDTDAIPAPDFLCHALMAFENAPETLGGVGGMLTEAYTEALPDAWRATHLAQHWGAARQYPPAFLFGADSVFRRAAVLDVGGYTESCRNNAEDVDLCNRLRATGCDISYTPWAWAEHQRQDSLPSLLRTRWHYELRYREACGYFDGLDACLAHLPELFDAAVALLTEDIAAGRPEFYPVDLLCFVYDALAGIRRCADAGRCGAEEAAAAQRSVRAIFDDYPDFFTKWIHGTCADLMLPDPGEVDPDEQAQAATSALRERLSEAMSRLAGTASADA